MWQGGRMFINDDIDKMNYLCNTFAIGGKGCLCPPSIDNKPNYNNTLNILNVAR